MKKPNGSGSVRTIRRAGRPDRFQAVGPRSAAASGVSLGVYAAREAAEAALDVHLRKAAAEQRCPPPLLSWPILGGVYFVAAGQQVKIGVAKNIRARLAGLQTSSPVPLRLLAFAPGGLAEERAYHREFAAHRLLGEWFELAPAILWTIGVLRRNARHGVNK